MSVYIDETGIDHYLYREYGRAKRGIPVEGVVSGKHYYRTSLVAGWCDGSVIAPLQYEGTMDSALFERWFSECLLSEIPRGRTILMDNAAFHRKAHLVILAQASGHQLLFLPPYSPDLNPIEKYWSLLKRTLRKILPYFSSFNDAFQSIFKPI